jgi:hypothetical protein
LAAFGGKPVKDMLVLSLTSFIEKGLQEQARQHLRAAADICAVGGIEFIAGEPGPQKSI